VLGGGAAKDDAALAGDIYILGGDLVLGLGLGLGLNREWALCWGSWTGLGETRRD
jgi:hypothetical protein